MVTGAASGIGLALTRALAARGVRVVMSDVQAGPLDDALRTLRSGGAEVYGVTADVRDAAAVMALADAALSRFGRIDLVCNNAGVVGPRRPSWEQDLPTWRWLIDVALLGVIHGIRAFVPHFVERDSGHVLNTASVGGLIVLPGNAPYAAVKHAVVAITEALREELRVAAPGVGATALCPGPVATGLGETSMANRPAGIMPEDRPRTASEVSSQHGAAMDADEVALMALEGIEEDRLHVITHSANEAAIRARIEGVLADLPPAS